MVHSVFYANGLSRLRRVDDYTWCQTKVWSKSRVTTRCTGRKEVVKIPTLTKTNTKTLSKFDPYLGTCDDSVPPRSGRLSSSSSTQLLLLPKGRNEIPCFCIFKLPPLHMQAYTILQPGSTDLQKHHKCLRALHVQMLTWMGKFLPDLCALKVKLPPCSYWFLAKVSPILENTEQMKKIVQLQKSGAVFQPRRISSSKTLHRSLRMENIIKECDTW